MESSDPTFDPVCPSLTQETAVGIRAPHPMKTWGCNPMSEGRLCCWKCWLTSALSIKGIENVIFLFLIFMRWSVGDDSHVLSPESEARVRVKYALITLHRLFLSFPGATTHTCRVPSATAKECKRLKIAHPGLEAAFKIRTLGCTTGFRLSVYSKWWANDVVAELSGGYTALVSKIAQWQVVNLSARRTEARSLEEDARTVLRFKCGSAFKYR